MGNALRLLVCLGLVLACLSCGALKVAGGTGGGMLLGSPLGPFGVAGGAVLGGVGGWVWDDHTRLEADKLKLEERLAVAMSSRDDALARQVDDLKRRLNAIPSVLPADPTLPTIHYGPEPPPKDDRSWWQKTPLETLVEKFRKKAK